MITLIVAASDNNVIGKNNELLWHLPKDFKRFKKLTTGHPIIMGRKTFDSLPGILPQRPHIIISRKRDLVMEEEECTVLNSLENAIKLAYAKDENPYIIGGGEIYKKAIKIADKIELTRVHTHINGDAFFPEIDPQIWTLVTEDFHSKNEKHPYDFTFLTYTRKTSLFLH